MFDRYRARLWARFSDNPPFWFWKMFFAAVLGGLAVGMAVSAYFLHREAIPFVGNVGAYFGLALVVAAGAGVVVLLLFRLLLRRAVELALQRVALRNGAGWGYVLQPLRRLNLPELADRLQRMFDEQVINQGNAARERHLVAGKFGFWVPDEQLGKILDDEGFYALRGKVKETSMVALATRGGTQALLGAEPALAAAFFQKQIARAVAFAKGANLIISDWNPEFCLLFADIPYTAKGGKVERLVAQAEKWLRETRAAWNEAGWSGEALCLLHYGPVQAGRLDPDNGGPYAVTGPVVREFIARLREAPAGISVSAEYAAKTGLASEGLPRAGSLEGWFQLGDGAAAGK